MNKNELIKVQREKLGLTVQQVATSCGVSKSTVSRWENGLIKNMKRNSVMSLANVLDINQLDLLQESNKKMNNFERLYNAYEKLNKKDRIKAVRYVEKLASKKK